MAIRRVSPRQRSHVRAWKKSSLTARQYAEQEGISHWSLYTWATSLNRQVAKDEAPAFLPVEVIEAPAPVEPIDLVLGNGRVVRVSCGFDSTTLSRVIEVAEGA
jgi:hypothetical protein